MALTESVPLPDVTFERKLTVHLGAREVRLAFLGRGNTAGDTVVHVPDAKVVITGDLLVLPTPYGHGAYPGDWIETLKRLMAIDALAIVPGHGPVQRDWRSAERLVSLLEALRAGVQASVRAGATLEERARGSRCRSTARSSRRRPRREEAFDAFFLQPAVAPTTRRRGDFHRGGLRVAEIDGLSSARRRRAPVSGTLSGGQLRGDEIEPAGRGEAVFAVRTGRTFAPNGGREVRGPVAERPRSLRAIGLGVRRFKIPAFSSRIGKRALSCFWIGPSGGSEITQYHVRVPAAGRGGGRGPGGSTSPSSRRSPRDAPSGREPPAVLPPPGGLTISSGSLFRS